MVSLSLSRKGKPLVRGTDGVAGRGGWKKRRPSCNEADRSWDITPRESGLTSVWSLITGELGEPPSRGNANDGQARTGWCALSRDECGVAASAYREGVTRFTRRTASPREGRLRGLSRVKGNCAPCHAPNELPPEVAGVQGNDSEANDLPGPERAREQQPVDKAGDSRRRVRCCSATPER